MDIAERAALKVLDDKLQISGMVIAILRDQETGLERVHVTRNIVTDAGDTYYAQRGAVETPTNDFTQLELGSAGTPGKTATTSSFTLIASTAKTVKSTYPKTNDGDTDNTGAGVDVVTWTFEYTAGDFNHAAITHGWIVVSGHGVGAPILTGFAFTGGAFAKTASDTLKVIINHTLNGV
jgi:hypothetical protein